MLECYHNGEKEGTSDGQVAVGQDVDALHHLRQLRGEGHHPPRTHAGRRELTRQVRSPPYLLMRVGVEIWW